MWYIVAWLSGSLLCKSYILRYYRKNMWKPLTKKSKGLYYILDLDEFDTQYIGWLFNNNSWLALRRLKGLIGNSVKFGGSPGAVMGNERRYSPDVMSGWSATVPTLRRGGKARRIEWSQSQKTWRRDRLFELSRSNSKYFYSRVKVNQGAALYHYGIGLFYFLEV